MEIISLISHNLLSFIVILSVIVFIHEFGHYLVARFFGIKIEEFAIGFGRELFGFNDKRGTRWKFCLWPLGGYVKMFGDRNPASIADANKVKKMTAAEKKVAFYHQHVFKRMAVVTAGPIFNFLLAIVIFTIIFRVQGLTTVLPIIDEVVPGSAAFESGLKAGDKILKVNEEIITEFSELQKIIHDKAGQELKIIIARENQESLIKVTPKVTVTKDFFGDEIKIAMIGIRAGQIKYQPLGLAESFTSSVKETYNLSASVLGAIRDLLLGRLSVKELGGPVRIAEYSGKSVDKGWVVMLWFVAMISINLGVMNLLPLPILDGGHFLYYVIEAIKGKPLSEKIQQYGFGFGMAVIVTLMLCTTYNDITKLLN